MLKMISIKMKLFICSIILILSLSGLGIFTYYENTTISDQIELLSEESVPSMINILNLKLCIVQIQQWLTDISATRGMEGFNDGFDESKKYYDEACDIIDTISAYYEDKQIIEEMRTELSDYYEMGKKMAHQYIDYGTEAGNEFMGEFDPYAEKITDLLQKLVDEAKSDLDIQNENVVLRIKKVSDVLSITFIIIIVLMTVIIFSLAISIIRPISKVTNMLKEISKGEGDLTKRLDDSSKDELGKLAKYFNIFTSNLAKIMKNIIKSADILDNASKQVSDAMNDANGEIDGISSKINNISNSINDNAINVKDISDGIIKMSEHVSIISENLDTLLVKSNSISSHSDEGVLNMNELNQMIKNVAVTTKDVYNSVESLNKSSNEILAIIEIVGGIAEKTKMLALNANIEAARAGTHGSGFAVVATEVSKLAENSKASVKQINEIVIQLQNKSKTAFSSITSGLTIVESASDKVNDTSDKFNTIAYDAKEIDNLVSDISDSMRIQKAKSKEIITTVQNVAESTDKNAVNLSDVKGYIEEQVAAIEEIAASLKEIDSMSSLLQKEASQFKI